MNIELILLIVMACLLLGWVVLSAIAFFAGQRKLLKEQDFIFQVKCEKCNHIYTVPCAQVAEVSMAKYKSVSRTKIKGGVLDNSPKYTYYAKKIDCPHCKRKEYGQIVNINEFQEMMRGQLLKNGIHALLKMAIGGTIIIIIMGIPINVVKQRRLQSAEQMRQQRYEELKNRYQKK